MHNTNDTLLYKHIIKSLVKLRRTQYQKFYSIKRFAIHNWFMTSLFPDNSLYLISYDFSLEIWTVNAGKRKGIKTEKMRVRYTEHQDIWQSVIADCITYDWVSRCRGGKNGGVITMASVASSPHAAIPSNKAHLSPNVQLLTIK